MGMGTPITTSDIVQSGISGTEARSRRSCVFKGGRYWNGREDGPFLTVDEQEQTSSDFGKKVAI